jgi:WS/DGAT/MGAT family acyltransferase
MLVAYLRERDELPARSLIAGVPVGLGTSRGGPVGGNSLSLMSASLHTDEPDPVARLHRVAASSKSGKAMVDAMGPELMMELVGLAPPIVVAGAAAVYSGLEGVRIHPPLVNAVVSNVRGAPIPLYLAGARMKATYPLGPIADGLGLNLTVISYVDSVDVGITVCPDLVPDPWQLVDALHVAMAELTPPRTRARRPRVPATAA